MYTGGAKKRKGKKTQQREREIDNLLSLGAEFGETGSSPAWAAADENKKLSEVSARNNQQRQGVQL